MTGPEPIHGISLKLLEAAANGDPDAQYAMLWAGITSGMDVRFDLWRRKSGG
jgi:hypothetical protein